MNWFVSKVTMNPAASGNTSFNIVNLILFSGFGWRHQQSALRHHHGGRGR